MKLENVTLIGADCVDVDRLLLAADISSQAIEFADIKILSSIPSPDPRVVPIKPITSTAEYSAFCVTKLANYVETEFALIIQYDGFILNPTAWDDRFLTYDYIGAPWYVRDWSVRNFQFPTELLGSYLVGNGGFSLRSKEFLDTCQTLASNGNLTPFHPEDVVLCVHNRHHLEAAGLRFAPVDIGAKFSFESFDDERCKWDGQFGFHGLRWTDISKWLDSHPEYRDKIDNTLEK